MSNCITLISADIGLKPNMVSLKVVVMRSAPLEQH